MSIQRPGTRQPRIYDGEGAVKDTAYEVRRARNQGIFVIGIFVGNEEELSVEKRIYGKDFAYIRNISNFFPYDRNFFCEDKFDNGMKMEESPWVKLNLPIARM